MHRMQSDSWPYPKGQYIEAPQKDHFFAGIEAACMCTCVHACGDLADQE